MTLGGRRAPGAGSSAAPHLGLSWPVQPRSETPTAPRRRGTPLPTGPARLFMPPLRLLRSRPVSCFSRRRADRGSGWAGPLRSPVPTQAPAPGGLFTGGSEGACLPGPTGCSSRGPLRPRTAIPLGVRDSEPPSALGSQGGSRAAVPGLTTLGPGVSPGPLPSPLAWVSGKRDFQKQSRPGCSGLCVLPACQSCPRAPQPLSLEGTAAPPDGLGEPRLLHSPGGPSSSGLHPREALGSCTGGVGPCRPAGEVTMAREQRPLGSPGSHLP